MAFPARCTCTTSSTTRRLGTRRRPGRRVADRDQPRDRARAARHRGLVRRGRPGSRGVPPEPVPRPARRVRVLGIEDAPRPRRKPFDLLALLRVALRPSLMTSTWQRHTSPPPCSRLPSDGCPTSSRRTRSSRPRQSPWSRGARRRDRLCECVLRAAHRLRARRARGTTRGRLSASIRRRMRPATPSRRPVFVEMGTRSRSRSKGGSMPRSPCSSSPSATGRSWRRAGRRASRPRRSTGRSSSTSPPSCTSIPWTRTPSRST